MEKNILLDNKNSEINDYEAGLCIIFLGNFAKNLELNIETEKNELKTEYIFFEPNPKFSFLSNQSKQKFIEDVDRTNHQSKIHGLITNCTYFEEEINLAENSIKKYSKLNEIYKHFYAIEIFLFLLSLIINFVLLIDYSNAVDSYQEHDFVDYIIIISGGFELFLSSVCLIIWFLLRFNIEKTLNEFRFCEIKG